MSCPPMFLYVYISLLLMTAGFVLTLCSWLAPPLNNIVLGVRIFGLVALLVGSLMLFCSCAVGAFNHGRCFTFCYMCDSGDIVSQNPSKYTTDVIENINATHENCIRPQVANHIPRSREDDTIYVPMTDHPVDQRICFDDKKDYGSCKVSLKSTAQDTATDKSPVREAVLVLSKEVAMGDNTGTFHQSHDGHVTPSYSFIATSPSGPNASDVMHWANGKRRFGNGTKTSKNRSSHKSDSIHTELCSLTQIPLEGAQVKEGKRNIAGNNDNRASAISNQDLTTGDEFVQTFMSG